MIYHDGYHDLQGLARIVTKIVGRLKPEKDNFDTILVTGVSGMVVGPAVALKLRKQVAVLRKPDDDTHASAGQLLQSHPNLGRVLFLDDFIAGGKTFSRCANVVPIVGIYTYRDHDLTWSDGTNDWFLRHPSICSWIHATRQRKETR